MIPFLFSLLTGLSVMAQDSSLVWREGHNQESQSVGPNDSRRAELVAIDRSVDLNRPGSYQTSFHMEGKYRVGICHFDPDLIEGDERSYPFLGFRVNGNLLRVGWRENLADGGCRVRSLEQGNIYFSRETQEFFAAKGLRLRATFRQTTSDGRTLVELRLLVSRL